MSWYSHESQIRWACLQLIRGREISHKDEIGEVRGWRLSAIIHNLRKRYHWPISTRYDANRVGYYRLGTGVDADGLKKPRSFFPKEKAALQRRPSKASSHKKAGKKPNA
ncbi:MAG: hypothetical protein EOM37_04980 [Proteobacteria bacterium]|nr:hypothetical protein [Pseudomonadota bacterium]